MIFRSRRELVEQLSDPYDVIIIGGGATGLGAALDAVSRGLRVALFERSDFTKGTSSRSTKLIHGGVRYLQSGQVRLVREGLKERGLLLRNAPHLVKPIQFFVPTGSFIERMYTGLGLKFYDLLSGRKRIGWSRPIAGRIAARKLPNLSRKKFAGGIVYSDGQFDDARLGLISALTCIEQGATALNYFRVIDLINDNGKVTGVKVSDRLDGKEYVVNGKAVINATGVFSDKVMKLSKSSLGHKVVASQGAHIVLDKKFLNSDLGVLVPKTSDGRVLFVIPWQGYTLAGTTDVMVKKAKLEPVPFESEIDFILETLSEYLEIKPTRNDILSAFAGLRPLIKQEGMSTKDMSREHTIFMSSDGLITITGGKWTAYRKMGQDVIDKAVTEAGLEAKPSGSAHLKLFGYSLNSEKYREYGSCSSIIEEIEKEKEGFDTKIHPEHPYTVAQVVYGVRNEHAHTLEDVLARRIRLLFLDARAAIESAPKVAKIMKVELEKDDSWVEQQLTKFKKLAEGYQA